MTALISNSTMPAMNPVKYAQPHGINRFPLVGPIQAIAHENKAAVSASKQAPSKSMA
jgi:hypothetical protein